MVLKLQASQVSALWDAIKLSAFRANKIPENYEETYAAKLLEAILSGRYEVWVLCYKEGEGTQIAGVGISAIVVDNLMGYTYLNMHSLYAFRPISDELKLEAWEALKVYAKVNDCDRMQTVTGHHRIKALTEMVGMRELHTTYVYDL